MYVLHEMLARTRRDELRRGDGLRSLRAQARASLRVAPEDAGVQITIRQSWPDDAAALERLAQLDSRPVPRAPALIAEVDGELRAALSLHDGATISHPFRVTTGALQLLATRAGQLSRSRGTRWGRWRAADDNCASC
jgi:hypothetical protein